MRRRCAFFVVWLWFLLIPLTAVSAAPTRYTIVERHGISWLKASHRRPFFSLGVCCVSRGTERKEYNAANPSYAWWRFYASPRAWADDTLRRLKAWGFTTVGGWSDVNLLRGARTPMLPYTVMIPMAMSVEGPWLDMWDPARVARMRAVTRAAMAGVRGDARCIGYYTDNEQGWWNFALLRTTLHDRVTGVQRRRLLALLRARYHNDWTRLRRDFDPDGADSFDALERGGTLYLQPGGHGMATVRAFCAVVAERYYRLVHDIVHEMDPGALVLGDRYQSFYYPEIARAAAPWVDVVSSNVNPTWNDGTVAHFYLDTLRALTHRPLMVTEFYATADENGSGDPNTSAGFVRVRTQAQRARCFARSVAAFASHPWVVGADWFQYWDEPPKGRHDGENYDMGLVDVQNRPYAALTATAARLDIAGQHAHAVRFDKPSHGVPPAPAQPLGDPSANEKDMMARWDRVRGFVPAATPLPLTDLYLCWNAHALYVGWVGLDPVEKDAWRGGQIPEVDRMRLRLDVTASGVHRSIDLRAGGGRAAVFASPSHGLRCITHSGNDVRWVAMVEIPLRLRAGQTVALNARLDASAGGATTRWYTQRKLNKL